MKYESRNLDTLVIPVEEYTEKQRTFSLMVGTSLLHLDRLCKTIIFRVDFTKHEVQYRLHVFVLRIDNFHKKRIAQTSNPKCSYKK